MLIVKWKIASEKINFCSKNYIGNGPNRFENFEVVTQLFLLEIFSTTYRTRVEFMS